MPQTFTLALQHVLKPLEVTSHKKTLTSKMFQRQVRGPFMVRQNSSIGPLERDLDPKHVEFKVSN